MYAVVVTILNRNCFVLTDDSQSSHTFVRVLNKVLSASLHCLLCDASFGKRNYTIHTYFIFTSQKLFLIFKSEVLSSN